MSAGMAQERSDVLILTGPPGSGKTTVAGLIAAGRERAVHLESDSFFHFIASGYIEPWKPEAHEQNQTVMAAIGEAAARYACDRYFTVIEGIVSPRWFFPSLHRTLADRGLSVSYAILRPSLLVSLQRARERPCGLSDPDVVEQLWGDFADIGALERHVMDSTDQTPVVTAKALDDRLRSGALTI